MRTCRCLFCVASKQLYISSHTRSKRNWFPEPVRWIPALKAEPWKDNCAYLTVFLPGPHSSCTLPAARIIPAKSVNRLGIHFIPKCHGVRRKDRECKAIERLDSISSHIFPISKELCRHSQYYFFSFF